MIRLSPALPGTTAGPVSPPWSIAARESSLRPPRSCLRLGGVAAVALRHQNRLDLLAVKPCPIFLGGKAITGNCRGKLAARTAIATPVGASCLAAWCLISPKSQKALQNQLIAKEIFNTPQAHRSSGSFQPMEFVTRARIDCPTCWSDQSVSARRAIGTSIRVG